MDRRDRWAKACVALVAFRVLLHIDARMALVAILPLVVVAAVAQRASGALARYRAASSQATSQVIGRDRRHLAAVQTLQAAGAEERTVARFRQLNERRRSAMLADRLATQALNAVTTNTVSVHGSDHAARRRQPARPGSLTVGDFVPFVSTLALSPTFTGALGQFLAHYQQTGVAFARMDILLMVTLRRPRWWRPPCCTCGDALPPCRLQGAA